MILCDGAERTVMAWIPARGGSKGLPGKALRDLGGRPVIAWTIQAALECAPIDRVVVNTDSPAIREAALAWGAEVPFLRPAELSGDGARLEDVLEHQWNWFLRRENLAPEIQIGMSPTFPIRAPGRLAQALAACAARPDVVCARSVLPLEAHGVPWQPGLNPGLGCQALPGAAAPGRRAYLNLFSFNIFLTFRFARATPEQRAPIPVALTPPEAIDLDDEVDLHMARVYLEGAS